MSRIPGLRSDPLPAFRFYITLIDSSSILATVKTVISAIASVALGGFSECTGLDMTMEVFEYKEGGVNDYVHKFPTRAQYGNIALKKGMGFTDDLWLWHYDFIQGKGKRRDGVIAMMNEMSIPLKVFYFKRGIPLKWTGANLNAEQSALAIESIDISHEGVELYSPHRGLAAIESAIF